MPTPSRGRICAAIASVSLVATACTHAAEPPPAQPSQAVEAQGVDSGAAALLPQNIKSKGTLTVAMDASYAPFEFFASDNTTITGLDVDLSSALAQTLGLKVEHVNAGFDTILPGLASGKYDTGQSAFSETPEREKTTDFVTYLKAGSGIAVAPGNPLGLKMDPTALCGRKVSAQKGSSQGIEQLPKISAECTAAGKEPVTIQLYPSQDQANLALTSGRADAVMADSISLAYQGKVNKQFELAPGEDYSPAPIGIALPKGSPLTPALKAAMAVLIADGTLAKITQNWGVPSQNTENLGG